MRLNRYCFLLVVALVLASLSPSSLKAAPEAELDYQEALTCLAEEDKDSQFLYHYARTRAALEYHYAAYYYLLKAIKNGFDNWQQIANEPLFVEVLAIDLEEFNGWLNYQVEQTKNKKVEKKSLLTEERAPFALPKLSALEIAKISFESEDQEEKRLWCLPINDK